MRVGPLQGRSVLVADDDDLVRGMLVRLLRSQGLTVVDVSGGGEAKNRLAVEHFDLVISDLSMPEVDGIAVIKCVKENHLQTPVIILTGAGGVPDAVKAMHEGAFDFLTKPFHPTSLLEVVKSALRYPERGKHLGRQAPLKEIGSDTAAVLLGQSAALRSLLEIVQQVGPTDATVLISGETGSGKEVIARLLHASSSRADKRLIAVNCAAIPEHLIESELFGHVKGAFTGAHVGRVGRLREADRGTVLLDEIGELPLSLQARLLRVLQDHLVTPVGSEQTYSLNVRFLAATNRDLSEMVRQGQFREDLYYRLNVVPIHVPPLRERLEDVPQLANYFLEQAANRLNRSIHLSEKALALLQLHSWPGNVRELENLIERMAILDRDGVVDADDLPPMVRPETGETIPHAVWAFTEEGVDLPTAVNRFERALIATAMRRSGNNKSQAAVLLGIGRTTLLDKIRKLGQ